MSQLPFPGERKPRLLFERAYALVSTVAHDSTQLLQHGDDLVTALVHLLKPPPGEGGGNGEDPTTTK